MPTDKDRREVARRLRGNPEDTLIPHKTGRHHGMGCREAADRFWNMCDRIKEAGNYDIAFSTTSVLADLIEPSDENAELCARCDYRDYCDLPECSEQDGYSFKPKGYVDLLVLADKTIRSARHDMEICGDTVPAWYAVGRLEAVAQSIREILGVES